MTNDLNEKDWTRRQVDRHLLDLLYWLGKGYTLTIEQREKIAKLAELACLPAY